MGEIHFHPEALIEEAMESTELNDFGRLPVRPGLAALCETYENNILDPEGRRRCRDRLVNLLTVRLRCERAFRNIPGIAQQEIHEPVFVTGLPESGATALINLLSQAPENRGLVQWEVLFPDPWPGASPGNTDPRYPQLVKAFTRSQDPTLRQVRYIDADSHQECCMIHSYAFSGVQLGFEVMWEPYRTWFLEQDLRPLYDYQKRLLQMLNWRNPGERWVLNAPAHMWAIDTIMRVFPDARFIWCHRHPLQVVASVNRLNWQVMEMYAGDLEHLDPAQTGRAVMDWYAMSLDRGLASRELYPANRFFDCSAADIWNTPMQLAERLYAAFGFEMHDEGRAAMQSFAGTPGREPYDSAEADLAHFGLTAEQVLERFDFYLQDERWPISD